MRAVGDIDQFTPFGIWLRHYCKDRGLSITNLDYVLEDYANRKFMLLEEKQSGGVLHNAQRLTFKILDQAIRLAMEQSKCEPQKKYDYWGFYIIQFPPKRVMPCPGMTLNGRAITSEQLVKHLNFEERFCDPLVLAQ